MSSVAVGIRPRRKSTTIWPVGVGFTSQGPMGAGRVHDHDGEAASARSSSATCSARNLDALYGPTMSASVTGVVFVAGRAVLGDAERPDARGVDDTPDARGVGRLEDGTCALDVGSVDLGGVAQPRGGSRRRRETPCARPGRRAGPTPDRRGHLRRSPPRGLRSRADRRSAARARGRSRRRAGAHARRSRPRTPWRLSPGRLL